MKHNTSMAYGCMMAPCNENKVFVDEWGYEWRQVTATGYRRVDDGFFIPSMGLYEHSRHSVEARIEIWEQIKNKTVVSTLHF